MVVWSQGLVPFNMAPCAPCEKSPVIKGEEAEVPVKKGHTCPVWFGLEKDRTHLYHAGEAPLLSVDVRPHGGSCWLHSR